MRQIFLFIAAALSLAVADERQELFKERSYHDTAVVKEAENVAKTAAGRVDMKQFQTDQNLSALGIKGDLFLREDNATRKEARRVYDRENSKEFAVKKRQMQEHILHDARMPWYSKGIEKLPSLPMNGGVPFGSDERLFVVISSSVPVPVLRTLLRRFEPVAGDAIFVMRGAIGGSKKLMPTMQWIESLITISGEKRYRSPVEINPNITRRYGISRVPAIIYVSGYDELAMQHGQDFNESVSIVYGAVDPRVGLEEINKKAKSAFLSTIIEKMP